MLPSAVHFLSNCSIRKKLIIFIVGISGFAIFLSSIFQVVYGTYHSRSTLDNELTILARVIGDQSTAALEFLDKNAAQENLSSLKEHHTLTLACLYGDDKQLFSSYVRQVANDLSRSDCPPRLLASSQENSNAYVQHQIERRGQVLGYLYVESDLTEVRQFAIRNFLMVTAVLSIALLLAYALTVRLHYVISSPILDLVNVTKQLSDASDYGVRATPGGEDELGTLVTAFNDMLDEIQQRDVQLHQLNEALELKVSERTNALQAANNSLTESLYKLNQTQDQLVQSEKMAALGQLVAGVAHEINTPIGVAVTAASHFEGIADQCMERYRQGTMSRGDFEDFLQKTSEIAKMVLANLRRAANLISSFKQLAVDQSSGEKRCFNLKKYIHETLTSLQPKFKCTKHRVDVNCPDDLELTSHPGAISQILTNFLMNSLIHGFENIEQGQISIDVEVAGESMQIRYRDNGKGISAEHIKKVFDPFFTTKRGQGGSGLGMNIVYNLVAQTLGGTIVCNSEPGQGVEFELTMPMTARIIESTS